jgi:hypothetical protein
MKTLSNIKVFSGLIIFLLLFGCDKETATVAGFENSAITKVEGPTTASVGQEVLIKVSLQGNNGCAVSGQLQETVNGSTRTIAGKVNYQGDVCTQAIVYIITNYSFKASSTGVYDLKFIKADGTFIVHTITVS